LAHNRLIDHWRAQRPQESLDEAAAAVPAEAHEAPAARAVQAEQGQRLLVALSLLAPEQREAFLLQAEGGLSLEEIAATQGVGRETVKSRLRYALAKLRKELADVWP
jgi:RNA polymerase sigma-70 factor (ECF subfamily)